MIKSGAIFLGTPLAIAAAGWACWKYVPWPHSSEAIAILVTGFLAALIAIWALFSQRAITRRQCTLEHIARLETDGDLIRGRTKFRELAKSNEGLVAWAAPDMEQSSEFQMITTRLNEFELISIGIQRGIIDLELYSRWFRSGTIRAWRDAEQFIQALRKRHNNPMIFHEFQEMVRWFENNDHPPRRSWWWGNLEPVPEICTGR